MGRNRAMIERWAKCLASRRAVEEFFAWLESQGIELYKNDRPVDEKLDALLNRFHGIDTHRLEVERRQALDEVRSITRQS